MITNLVDAWLGTACSWDRKTWHSPILLCAICGVAFAADGHYCLQYLSSGPSISFFQAIHVGSHVAVAPPLLFPFTAYCFGPTLVGHVVGFQKHITNRITVDTQNARAPCAAQAACHPFVSGKPFDPDFVPPMDCPMPFQKARCSNGVEFFTPTPFWGDF